MKKIVGILIIVSFLLTAVGCMTTIHKVGNGAQGKGVDKTRVWYVLWGLVPINNNDTTALADGAKNYEVVNQVTFVDGLISCFTGIVTVNCKTVQVKK